jgi:hypothetical protein
MEVHIGPRVHFDSYMNVLLRIPLKASAEQHARLQALQVAFSQVCNTLAPLVQQSRVWNRVALHHASYRQLREKFPALGSQMVCNAIYSVSRMSRLVYQHPNSPFNVNSLGDKPLPVLRFAETCPVYFDRHTLSLRKGQLSMFTLDGRMHFQVALRPDDETAFHEKKLREIVLLRTASGSFDLSFWFSDAADGDAEDPARAQAQARGEIPEYVMVEETT